MNNINTDQIIAEALARGDQNCPQGVNPAMWEMAKAQFAARSVAAAPAPQMPAVMPTNAGLPSMMPQPMVPTAFNPSLDVIDPVGMAVDAYFKVAHGSSSITVDKETKAFANKEFKVVINMAEVKRKQSIKGGVPVQYGSTYDGEISVDGKSWLQVLQEFKILDPRATPYVSYDIPMTLLEDLTAFTADPTAPNGVRTEIVAKVGSTVGHSTPTTGKTNFQNLIKQIQAVAGTAESGQYVVKVSREDRHSKEGFKWGVFAFDLVGPYAGQ